MKKKKKDKEKEEEYEKDTKSRKQDEDLSYNSDFYNIASPLAISSTAAYGLNRLGRYKHIQLEALANKAARKSGLYDKLGETVSDIGTGIGKYATDKLTKGQGNGKFTDFLAKAGGKIAQYAPQIKGTTSEAAAWVRNNWEHGGLAGKAKVAGVTAIPASIAALGQIGKNIYTHKKDRETAEERKANAAINKISEEQKEDLQKRNFELGNSKSYNALAAGVAGTGVTAAGMLTASQVARHNPNFVKLLNNAGYGLNKVGDLFLGDTPGWGGAKASLNAVKNKDLSKAERGLNAVFGVAGCGSVGYGLKGVGKGIEFLTPEWLQKLAGRKPDKALKILKATGLPIISQYAKGARKLAKVGGKINKMWDRGPMGKALVATIAASPGIALGAYNYGKTALLKDNHNEQNEEYQNKDRHAIRLSNIAASTTASGPNEIVGAYRGLNPANIAAGNVSSSVGAIAGKDYANRLDEQGLSDNEILKKSTQRGRLIGAGAGAGLGALAGAFWGNEKYRPDVKKYLNTIKSLGSLKGIINAHLAPTPEAATKLAVGAATNLNNAYRYAESQGVVLSPAMKKRLINDYIKRGAISAGIVGALGGDRGAYANTKARLDLRNEAEERVANGENITNGAYEKRKEEAIANQGKNPYGKAIAAGLGAGAVAGTGLYGLGQYAADADWIDKLDILQNNIRDSKLGQIWAGKDRGVQLERAIDNAGMKINDLWDGKILDDRKWYQKPFKKQKTHKLLGRAALASIPLSAAAATGLATYKHAKNKQKKEEEKFGLREKDSKKKDNKKNKK